MSEKLLQRDSSLPAALADARNRVVRVRLFLTIAWAFATLLAGLASVAVLDWWWELPTIVRAMGLFAVVATSLVVIGHPYRRWVGRYSLSHVAAQVEACHPEHGQRLRTLVDYSDPQARPARATPALVSALQRESATAVPTAHIDGLAAQQRIWPVVVTLGVGALLGGMSLLSDAEWRIAVGRVILLPWDYTTVTFTPASAVVKEGADARIEAHVAGRPVREALLRYRPVHRKTDWKELPLRAADGRNAEAADLHGDLAATIADCQEELVFQVVAGPRDLPLGEIHVLRPLTVEAFEARLTPPSYTGRGEETTERREFKVLEGTNVAFQVKMNRAAQEAILVLVSAETTSEADADDARKPPSPGSVTPLRVEGERLSGQLPDLRFSSTWELQVRAADRVTSEPARLAIQVQADRPPRLKFVRPPEDLEVTPTTEVPLAVEAVDDVGLHKVGVLYQVGDGPLQTLWEQDFGGSAEPQQFAPLLSLEDNQLTFRDSVTYHAFAEDDYFGQPRRTLTALRFIDIRPYKRSYQLLDNGGT